MGKEVKNMERKSKQICGITGTDCPNNKCQYTGTGYGCLHSGEMVVNGNEESHNRLGTTVREKIHRLSTKQAELRVKLAEVGSGSPEAKEIRGNMMENRLGEDGLRALNNKLRDKGWNK